MSTETLYLLLFSIGILGVLFLDLTVIGRKSHILSFKESIIWTAVWVSLALLFFVFLLFNGDKLHSITSMDQLLALRDSYAPHLKNLPSDLSSAIEVYRKNMAMEFISGYLTEYTLSMDNVFVIMLILGGFSVPQKYYKQVLFWGILGAIILRFIFIFIGAALIAKFNWVLLVFGAFLVYSGVKMFLDRNKDEKIVPQDHWLVKYLSKHFRIFPRYVKGRFCIRKQKQTFFTPLVVVLILVEFTDLVFATDSIPAIFAITRDPYIVFFSNIFAIIGLRSLFFLLLRVVDLFHYLNVGIAILLAFVGLKLLFHHWLDQIGFNSIYSLYVIVGTLALSIVASLVFPKKDLPDVELPE
jgi:tellurite resistance protein TerC